MISTSQFAFEQVKRRLMDLAAKSAQARERPGLEAVHAVRVAIRHVQPVLDVFERCFDVKRLNKLRDRLHDVLALAGQVRDCDIAIELLAGSRAQGVAGLRTRIHAQREESASRLRLALEAGWEKQLAVVSSHPKFCSRAAQETARRELAGLARDFFHSGDHAAASSRTSARRLHRLRIAAKQLRYTLDLFSPFYGDVAHEMLAKVRDVQSLLGAVNNHRMARDIVRALAGNSSILEQLRKKQRKKMKGFRRMWRKEFPGALVKRWIRALGQN